jgi:hypothetical protein
MIFLFCLLFTRQAGADPGYLWLEPGPQMSRAGGGDTGGKSRAEHRNSSSSPAAASRQATGHDVAGSTTHAPEAPTERKASAQADPAKKDEKKPPREKRAAMSHPAHYTLMLGWPPGPGKSDESLLAVKAAIIRPDGSTQKLSPGLETPDVARIRDAALIQGRYLISASLRQTQGTTRYRLYTQTVMRNTGEKPKGDVLPDQTDFETDKARLVMEDLSPDPGKNFARVHRKYTGDKLPLRMHLNELPLAGQPVTLATASGWRQTLQTDEKGEVTFALIKESFHDEGTKKRPVTYFVTSEIRKPLNSQDGYREEVLRAALAIMVYPSPLDWESRSAGIYVLVLVMAAVGVATAIRRRQRRRPCA